MLSLEVEATPLYTVDVVLPGGMDMIKQWWAQQSENLQNWMYRKRLLAMQQRIRKQKALLNGGSAPSPDEMHALRSEILRDIQGHAIGDRSLTDSMK